jgi:signal peptidase I
VSENGFQDNQQTKNAEIKEEISRDDTSLESQSDGDNKPDRVKGPVREVFESIVIAVILAVIIRVLLFQFFIIPSGSMEPTLTDGDMIVANKMIYRFSEPKRGDIIVFKYPPNPDRDFVKRLIGLPGEKVLIKDSILHINGKVIAESYLPKGLKFQDYGPVTVPEDKYFMMGDNRNNSLDSRAWGEMPKENIIGKASVIYWPIKRIRILH